LYFLSIQIKNSENDPWHFGSIPIAFVSLFRASTLEDWSEIMFFEMVDRWLLRWWFGWDGRDVSWLWDNGWDGWMVDEIKMVGDLRWLNDKI